MNNNILTSEVFAYLQSKYQIVKLEVLNVRESSQNIGTNDYEVIILICHKLVKLTFNYHAKLKYLEVILNGDDIGNKSLIVSSSLAVELNSLTSKWGN